MKKQRILALTLAATTAMSMFAGMSVSAAATKDPTDGFHSYTPVTGTIDWDTYNTQAAMNLISTDSYTDVMTNGFASGGTTIYLFDYKEGASNSYVENGETKKYYSLEDVQNAVTNAQYSGDAADITDAINKLNKFYGETPAPDFSDSIGSMGADRKAIVALYETEYKRNGDLDLDNYSADDKIYYDIAGMQAGFTAVGPISTIATKDGGKLNSQLAHMAAEGKRIMDEIAPTVTVEESYNEKLEKAQNLVESDYTAANYKSIVRNIEDAEDLAAEGKYSDAIKKLDAAIGTTTITPKYTDLANALKGLFTDSKIPGYSLTATIAAYAGTTNSGDKFAYVKADYDDTDAWEAFAGNDKATTDPAYVEGAYRAAMDVYRKCMNAGARKTVGQSMVDEAKENLDAAILGLDPNFSTANWLTVKMEEALEKADKVVEDDYRTNTSVYKNFIKAKEALEKLLDNGAVKTDIGEKAINDLTTAQSKLSTVKKAVPAATSNELNSLKKEATTLLKKTDGKTLAQVTALQDALAAANKINSTKTISEYETAIDALKTAIANYNQLQGWYQENGVWYYGQGNGKATGWLHLGSDWYWLDQTTGAMAANTWKEINGAWYYFYGSGKMVAGKWHQINGTWYAFTNSGAMRKGWFKSPDNDNWYYLNPSSGAMVANGWYKINGKDYYFYANGSMAANTTIGGYTVGADGAWIK